MWVYSRDIDGLELEVYSESEVGLGTVKLHTEETQVSMSSLVNSTNTEKKINTSYSQALQKNRIGGNTFIP